MRLTKKYAGAISILGKKNVIVPSLSSAFPCRWRRSYSTVLTTNRTTIGAPGGSMDFCDIYHEWAHFLHLAFRELDESLSHLPCTCRGLHSSGVDGASHRYPSRGLVEIRARPIGGEPAGPALPTSEDIASLSLGAFGESKSDATVMGMMGNRLSPHNLAIPVFRPTEG